MCVETEVEEDDMRKMGTTKRSKRPAIQGSTESFY